MTYERIVDVLIVIALGAMAFGMFNHARLISKAGVWFAVPEDRLDASALSARRRVFIGYGIFIAVVAICLALSLVSGPTQG